MLQVLVREPLKVINSFSEVLETTLEETSYPSLCRIVSELRALGCAPPGCASLLKTPVHAPLALTCPCACVRPVLSM